MAPRGPCLAPARLRGTADCGKVPPAGAVASSTGQHSRGRAHEARGRADPGVSTAVVARVAAAEWDGLRDGGFSPITRRRLSCR